MALPNARAALTILIVRELPRAIAKRVRLPRRRAALAVAILAVVAVATAAAVVPLAVGSRTAEGPAPAAGTTGFLGAGNPSSATTPALSFAHRIRSRERPERLPAADGELERADRDSDGRAISERLRTGSLRGL
jgi:hypothetical protein